MNATAEAQNATTHALNSTTDDNSLPPIAIHFIIVGSLFGMVVILAIGNIYVYYRTRDQGRVRRWYGDDRRVVHRVPTVSKRVDARNGGRHSLTVKMKPLARR